MSSGFRFKERKESLLAPPKTLVNAHSSGGSAGTALTNIANQGKDILSGALTADTYKEVLAITGAGAASFIGAKVADTTSRTIGLKVVVDGVTVFDATTAALTAASAGGIAVGVPSVNTGYPTMPTDRIDWKTSLSVSIKSSVTETDKVSAVVAYQLF